MADKEFEALFRQLPRPAQPGQRETEDVSALLTLYALSEYQRERERYDGQSTRRLGELTVSSLDYQRLFFAVLKVGRGQARLGDIHSIHEIAALCNASP